METPDTISPTELKRLIITLKDHSPNARIRFRLIGSMWEKNFLEIVHATTENAVIVQDRKSDQMKFISLGNVVEFEIEQRFQNFKPLYHYKVAGS